MFSTEGYFWYRFINIQTSVSGQCLLLERFKRISSPKILVNWNFLSLKAKRKRWNKLKGSENPIPPPSLFFFISPGNMIFVLVHIESFWKSDWLHIELCVQPLWFERNCIFQNKARSTEKRDTAVWSSMSQQWVCQVPPAPPDACCLASVFWAQLWGSF